MPVEFDAPSGAKIVINPCTFEQANYLKRVMERAALASGGIDNLFRVILTLDSSEEVNQAIWPCLQKSLRNSQKIVPATFDDLDARKDYYPIVEACLKMNVGPLEESLSSLLEAKDLLKKKLSDIPKPA